MAVAAFSNMCTGRTLAGVMGTKLEIYDMAKLGGVTFVE